jgi:hypothetical protein
MTRGRLRVIFASARATVATLLLATTPAPSVHAQDAKSRARDGRTRTPSSATQSARAQTRDADGPRANAQAPRAESSTADEDFELNIDQRRINEGDFHAETAVSTDGSRGLQLNVGVTLRASDIDVLLRNVRGRVRFHASLEQVLRLLDARRGAPDSARAALKLRARLPRRPPRVFESSKTFRRER